jgi:hypothetical protein
MNAAGQPDNHQDAENHHQTGGDQIGYDLFGMLVASSEVSLRGAR